VCALAVGAMSFVANAGQAALNSTNYVTLTKLSFSGSFIVNSNSAVTKGSSTVLTPLKGSFNNKSLVALLNASPAFTNYLNNQTAGGINTLPPNTTFGFDDFEGSVFAIVPTGGWIPLTDVIDNAENNFNFITWDWDETSDNYSYNKNTGAGSENVQLSEFYFEFNDYNETSPNNFYFQGQMNYKFTSSAVASALRKVTASDSFSGSGDVEVGGYYGTGKGNASGSSKSTSIAYTYLPFWNWY
jgi:hypothetical protein